MTSRPTDEHLSVLRARIDYFRDLGVYDFYRRSDAVYEDVPAKAAAAPSLHRENTVPPPSRDRLSTVPPPSGFKAPSTVPAPVRTPVAAPLRAVVSRPVSPSLEPPSMPLISFDDLSPVPAILPPDQRLAALQSVQEEIGDCTRCPLAYGGRRKIVFGDGDPNASLMFVGEAPGADEDEQGVPFVGKAGQLLNNMIAAMGLRREQVYIANIVKCRPPNNRVPEPAEASICTRFLVRQMDIVRPKVVVALGATAALYLLGRKAPLSTLRGQWHAVRGAKLVVTYHPAYLLRDPRQKGEAWKDLQMVMSELGLKPAPKA